MFAHLGHFSDEIRKANTWDQIQVYKLLHKTTKQNWMNAMKRLLALKEPQIDLGLLALCAAILQVFLALNTVYPYVIENGDNGSILYIIAGWVRPDAFAQDALLGVSGTTTFYQAALMWPNYILGVLGIPLGIFYVWSYFPIAFIQMWGFYRLGKHLNLGRGFSLCLALISLPAIYTISGDLWGMFYSPLMRSAYGATLPWLLLMLVRSQSVYPFKLMLAAGFLNYLHLPSGPPIALGLLLTHFLMAGFRFGWLRASGTHVLGGLLYLAIVAPYILLFATATAAGNETALGLYDKTVYGNVYLAFKSVRSLDGIQYAATQAAQVAGLGFITQIARPLFAFIYLAGVAVLAILSLTIVLAGVLKKTDKLGHVAGWGWVALFFISSIGSGVGLAMLDQWVAALSNRAPLQVDLIRVTRFIVPAGYFGVFCGIVWLSQFHTVLKRIGVFSTSILTLLVWLIAFPSTSQGLYRLATGKSIEDTRLTEFGAFTLTLRARDDLGVLTPILQSDHQSSALRYIGFMPLTFNRKDNNFITYSGVTDVDGHHALVARIDEIRRSGAEPTQQAALIDAFVRDLKGRDTVIDRVVVSKDAEAELINRFGFTMISERGDFALLRRP